MEKTTNILRDVEVMLLKAELRIALLNGALMDFSTNKETLSKVLEFQVELEAVHQLTTKLENSLLKKLNQVLRHHLEMLKREENAEKPDSISEIDLSDIDEEH